MVTAALPMPDHVRRRLTPPTPPEEDAPAPMPALLAVTPEMQLALVVTALFRDLPGKPRGTLARPDQRARLAADAALSAYFASVAAAGDDGWAEERMRLVDRLKDLPPEQRGDPQNVYAIAELMPTWRAWGQVLVDAASFALTYKIQHQSALRRPTNHTYCYEDG